MTGVNGKKPELTSFRDAVLADTARAAPGSRSKTQRISGRCGARQAPTMPEDSGIKLVQASAITPRKAAGSEPVPAARCAVTDRRAPGSARHNSNCTSQPRSRGAVSTVTCTASRATSSWPQPRTRSPKRWSRASWRLEPTWTASTSSKSPRMSWASSTYGEDLDALEAVAKAIEPAPSRLIHWSRSSTGSTVTRTIRCDACSGRFRPSRSSTQVAINGLIHLNKRDGHDALTRISAQSRSPKRRRDPCSCWR